MNIVITGSSCGMGEEIAKFFLGKGYTVHGIDVLPSELTIYSRYTHHIANVIDKENLPDIPNVAILINNAGTWDSGRDIDINLRGLMNCTEKYALSNPKILSVLNQCDGLAIRGEGFPEYVASKGGVYAYTKWTAKEIAKYGATCNSISFGGVLTELNDPIMQDAELWKAVMDQNPLKKWVSADEVAEWVYFLTVVNKSCSGQDIVVDNLESLNGMFIWK